MRHQFISGVVAAAEFEEEQGEDGKKTRCKILKGFKWL